MAFYVNLKFYEKWMNFIMFNLACKDNVIASCAIKSLWNGIFLPILDVPDDHMNPPWNTKAMTTYLFLSSNVATV